MTRFCSLGIDILLIVGILGCISLALANTEQVLIVRSEADLETRLNENGVKHVVLFSINSRRYNELQEQLQTALAGEDSVQIATWVPSRSSQLYGTTIERDGIYLAQLVPRDRQCLLSLSSRKGIKVKRFHGTGDTVTAEALLKWVNKQCGTFRSISGGLTEQGIFNHYLLSNLYDVTRGDSCEYIDHVPSPAEFFEYVSSSKPVVFRSLLFNLETPWPALNKWTNKYLRQTVGNNEVNVKLTPEGEFEGCEDASLWAGSAVPPPEVMAQLESPDKVVVRPADLTMRFSSFLDMLNNPNVNASFYLEYTSIASSTPQLLQDVSPLSFASFLRQSVLNIWISNGKTLGKLHYDPFDNLLCQIAGSKEVTLFSPHYNENLYEGHIREAQLSYDPTTNTFSRNKFLESTSMVMSPVNIKNPDMDRYPLFANVKDRSITCTINKGDVLFMPSFWWHEVQSRPDEDQRNIAVNFWFEPYLAKEFPCRTCRLYVSPVYDNLYRQFPLRRSTDSLLDSTILVEGKKRTLHRYMNQTDPVILREAKTVLLG